MQHHGDELHAVPLAPTRTGSARRRRYSRSSGRWCPRRTAPACWCWTGRTARRGRCPSRWWCTRGCRRARSSSRLTSRRCHRRRSDVRPRCGSSSRPVQLTKWVSLHAQLLRPAGSSAPRTPPRCRRCARPAPWRSRWRRTRRRDLSMSSMDICSPCLQIDLAAALGGGRGGGGDGVVPADAGRCPAPP